MYARIPLLGALADDVAPAPAPVLTPAPTLLPAVPEWGPLALLGAGGLVSVVLAMNRRGKTAAAVGVGTVVVSLYMRGRRAVPPGTVPALLAADILPGAPGTTYYALPPASAGPGGVPISTAARGTGATAPLATATGVVNGVPLAQAMDPRITPIPSLAMVLDDSTAMMLRAYVALHPEDFQVFLNRYADRIRLREDMFFQAVTNPPAAGFQPTPTMIASLGPAAYKVVQGLNGVAAGNTGDIFGVASTVAGRIPGLNPDFVHSLQGLTLGYRAFSAGLQLAQISEIAVANGVSLMNVTSVMLQTGGQVESLGMGAAAGSLAGAPIASFAGVLMAVGLCVDIAFTIIGDAPDLQKAIDVALDVASLVCLFIPVVGWVIAIIIQLVKFLIDLFAEDLFYPKGHAAKQRELLETATYGERLSRMFPILADSYTPRELFGHIVEWGSGYCGGKQEVAMMVALTIKAGDQFMVGGHLYTAPADTSITLGENDNPRCYWFAGGPFETMTNDEQAWALARYASDNGVVARAQVGISPELKVQFEVPTQQLIEARCETMKMFTLHGVSLDQIDQIAAEYRAQPALHALAAFFGYAQWQDMLGTLLTAEWRTWSAAVTHGTLTDFARAYGYPTMYALRAAAFAPWQALRDRLQAAEAAIAWLEARLSAAAAPYYSLPTTEPSAADVALLPPGNVIAASVLRRVAALEARVDAYDRARAAEVALIAEAKAAAMSGTAAPEQMFLVLQTAQSPFEAAYWSTIQAASGQPVYEDLYAYQLQLAETAAAQGGNGGG